MVACAALELVELQSVTKVLRREPLQNASLV
jgi:hypothetical protein